MGTLLFSRGIPQRACLDELVLTRADLVATIHREYLEAGADLIETATFGANRVRLAAWGLEAMASRMNRRAAQLAREARDVTGRDALIAGSVGPLERPGRPIAGDGARQVARGVFREQIDGLLEGGVDLLMLETFSELEPLLLALDEARAAAGLPVVASLTFGEEWALSDGTSPEAAAAALAAAGADAVGVNCGTGPVGSLDALVRVAGTARLPGSVLPNAGLSQRVEGRFVFAAGPDWFAEMVPDALAAGARIIGGCCGTTPEHVAAMRIALDRVIGTPRSMAPAAGSQPPPSISSAGGDGRRGGHHRPVRLVDPQRRPRPDRRRGAAADAPSSRSFARVGTSSRSRSTRPARSASTARSTPLASSATPAPIA